MLLLNASEIMASFASLGRYYCFSLSESKKSMEFVETTSKPTTALSDSAVCACTEMGSSIDWFVRICSGGFIPEHDLSNLPVARGSS